MAIVLISERRTLRLVPRRAAAAENDDFPFFMAATEDRG